MIYNLSIIFSVSTFIFITMQQPKQKIILNNSQKYQFMHLLRHFQTASKSSPEFLQSSHVLSILSHMGYLSQHLCEQDYELVRTVTHLLAFPRGQGTLSQRNLFRFLMAVTQSSGKIDSYFDQNVTPLPKDASHLIQPLVPLNLGAFDENGRWQLTGTQENEVKQIFKQMVFTKASRPLLDNKGQNEEQQHQPHILKSSKIMAQKRFSRTGSQNRVEDRLLQGKKLFESRIEQQLHRSLEKKLEECSFKPTINSFVIHPQKQNFSSINNRGEKLMLKGKQYELKLRIRQLQKEEREEQLNRSCCSFEPDLASSQASLKNSVKRQHKALVKNEGKAVNRMKIARQQRQYVAAYKKREYPKGKSWTKYLGDSRKTIQNNFSKELYDEIQILTLNFEAFGENIKVEVKDGQAIDNLTNSLCNKCHIPSEMKGNLLNLVKTSINNSGQALIKNGRVCINE